MVCLCWAVLGFALIEFYCLSSIIGSVRVDVDESNWHLDLLGSGISVALISYDNISTPRIPTSHVQCTGIKVSKRCNGVLNIIFSLIPCIGENIGADLHNDLGNKPQFN